MQQWSLGHSNKGYFVNVRKIPAWTTAVEYVVGWSCTLTGGILGGHPRWDKVYEAVPEAVWDTLHELHSKAFSLDSKYGTFEARLPITKEQAEKISPEFFQDMEELDSDDNV